LFKLKYSDFGRFSNWLCSVIDTYRLDTLSLCLLDGCAHSRPTPTATSVRYKVGGSGGIVVCFLR